ncbi:S-layer protein [uncultured archaeon]|nr:S-layer protein [uncultured archaeon]
MVQLKYTWLISSTVTEVKSGDKYGIFKVDATEGASGLTLKSDSAITLSSDGTNDLLGNIKFRTADNTSVLRFYPKVDVVLGQPTDVTPTPTTGAGVTPTTNVTVKPTTTGTLVVTPEKPPGQTPLAAATPTATKTEPGFELAFAIAGLLAVAYLVLRQRK